MSDQPHASVALHRDPVRRGYRHVHRCAGGSLDWEYAGVRLDRSFVEPPA